MPCEPLRRKYCQLIIVAADEKTDIWVGCDKGHFVDKGVGRVDVDLLPGHYSVEFGLRSNCHMIDLSEDLTLTQSQIEAGPTCQRPEVVLLGDDGKFEDGTEVCW